MTGRRQDMDVKPDRRALRIMEALSGVDEALLERCETEKERIDYNSQIKRRRRKRDGRGGGSLWRHSKAWAAVLCLAVVGSVSWGGYQLTRGVGGDGASGGCDNQAAPQQGMPIEASAAEAGEAEMAGAQEEGSIQEEALVDSNGAAADSGGTSGDNTAPAAGLSAEGDRESEKQQAMAEQNNDRKEDREDKYETESGSERPFEEILTEADARSVEKLGDYVPTALPEGYVFEHAFRGLNAEEADMSVYWSRGMDSIGLYIVEGKEITVTVDVSRPETYDERLYEIPYAESVPAEYRELFDDPVFALEDFSLEIVKSRMISMGDGGDTDTPRGNFTVLYPDGVLVRFNGRGTAEEIWELFDSIQAK